MSSFGGMGGQLSLSTDNLASSTWEEMTSSSTPNRSSTSEYVPQHIMSPAEMLRLEEQLGSAAHDHDQGRSPKLDKPGDVGLAFMDGAARPRTNSILSNMSMGTLAFGDADRSMEDESALGTFMKPSLPSPSRWPASPVEQTKPQSPRRPSTAAVRSNTLPAVSVRPSTAQPIMASPITPASPAVPVAAGGLPPPPRFRAVAHHSREESETDIAWKRASTAPVQPLSPPPRSKTVRSTITHQTEDLEDHSRSNHPPSAFNAKRGKRRSIMRKPSFLEIDDDGDEEDDDGESILDMGSTRSVAESIEMECSFLDLDKGKDSFDTVRSFDDPFRVL